MDNPEIVLEIARLVFGGLTAFLSILLWSRTRDGAWTSFAAGCVSAYTATVLSLLRKLGINPLSSLFFPKTQIPLIPLLSIVIPGTFFVISFIIFIWKTR